MIKAIIFDFDGVLVESVDIKTKAFAKLFDSEGKDAVKKIVDYHVNNTGVSRFEKFKYIYNDIFDRKLTQNKFKQLCDRFSKLVMDSVISAPYVRGAEDFLNKYEHKYRFFIASATPQDEMVMIIKKRKMMGFFTGVYGSPSSKKEIVKKILDEQKLSPHDVIYVGDALSDYDAAFTNRVRFIARIPVGGSVLHNIDVRKVKDLIGLENVLASF